MATVVSMSATTLAERGCLSMAPVYRYFAEMARDEAGRVAASSVLSAPSIMRRLFGAAVKICLN